MPPLFAIPFIFQAVASSICPVNQYVGSNATLCYAIVASPEKPNAVDAQILDLAGLEYLQTKWLDSTTMLSKIETATTTYCWYNDQTTETFPCDAS